VLIDFGRRASAALESLKLVDRVRAEFQAGAAPALAPRTRAQLVEAVQRHSVPHLQCTP